MRILLTGATGYIGKRLLPSLVDKNHFVICCVRDKNRFNPPSSLIQNISVIEVDLLKKSTLDQIPADIDVAFYLVHSMTSSNSYNELEKESAYNFRMRMNQTKVQQVIYLSGIVNKLHLSKHLMSRKMVEVILGNGQYHFTCLRAGIIIGSGSASFEMMRDLVEKLPIMITPKWLNTKCQPIGIADVLSFLTKSMLEVRTYDKNFDIGCADILSYKDMLLELASVRHLKRRIWIVPFLSLRLSSYYLYFFTSASYKLARSLVESLKVEVVCRNDELNHILDIHPISYREAVTRAFSKIENNEIVSSWKDSYASSGIKFNISEFISVPSHGCYKDKRIRKIENYELCLDRLWCIGGENGWYYGTIFWKIRGYIDKIIGGVGLRRGRTHLNHISVGDALDFWRVLYADKTEGRLLLLAEMKLPGEAWLEFKIKGDYLYQTATFRPLGLAGRLYWYSVSIFHIFIFRGLIRKLTSDAH